MSNRGRLLASAIFQRALAAVDPRKAVHRHLIRAGERLSLLSPDSPPRSFDLREFERIFVVGCGKAGSPMAQALDEILGERITAGAVAVKRRHHGGYRGGRIELLEAGHPEP